MCAKRGLTRNLTWAFDPVSPRYWDYYNKRRTPLTECAGVTTKFAISTRAPFDPEAESISVNLALHPYAHHPASLSFHPFYCSWKHPVPRCWAAPWQDRASARYAIWQSGPPSGRPTGPVELPGMAFYIAAPESAKHSHVVTW